MGIISANKGKNKKSLKPPPGNFGVRNLKRPNHTFHEGLPELYFDPFLETCSLTSKAGTGKLPKEKRRKFFFATDSFGICNSSFFHCRVLKKKLPTSTSEALRVPAFKSMSTNLMQKCRAKRRMCIANAQLGSYS